VADSGVGVPNHLRGNPEYSGVEDDAEAILRALRPGVSGTRDRRGYGFFDILREMSEVGKGELLIVAGSAVVSVPFGSLRGRKRRRALRTSIRGSWIQVRLAE
jgi:hypothetical protein